MQKKDYSHGEFQIRGVPYLKEIEETLEALKSHQLYYLFIS